MPDDAASNANLADLAELPDGWEYQPLSELVDDKRGICYGIVQPGSHSAEGIPIVRVNNIKGGRIDTSDMLRVTGEIESKYVRSRLRGGEVLLTLVGSLGESAVVPPELAGWNVARAVGVLPVKEDMESRWVALCLRSSTTQHFIHTRATTTVQATFNLRDVAMLPIPVPPKKEREAIASVLGSLDDKIELNRRMNETLEALAQSLFKSWFVDLDPYRVKVRVTSALPKGWAMGKLSDIAEIVMGLSPDGNSYNANGEGMPLINGPVEFGDYFPVKSKWTTSPTRMAQAGDLIFCVRGSTTGRRVISDDAYCLGRGVCGIRAKNGAKAFLYQTVNFGLENLLSKTTGSVFPSLSAPDIKGLPIILPPSEVVARFSEKAEPLAEKIQANVRESRTLAALRDGLLPKLLSGELRVPVSTQTKEAG